MKRLKLTDANPEPDTDFELTEVFAFPDPMLALFLDNFDEKTFAGINLDYQRAKEVRDWLDRWLRKVDEQTGNEKWTIWTKKESEGPVLCRGLEKPGWLGEGWYPSRHFLADDPAEVQEKLVEWEEEVAQWRVLKEGNTE